MRKRGRKKGWREEMNEMVMEKNKQKNQLQAK
jgi:hypothetical protein